MCTEEQRRYRAHAYRGQRRRKAEETGVVRKVLLETGESHLREARETVREGFLKGEGVLQHQDQKVDEHEKK